MVRGFQCTGITVQDSVDEIINGIGCVQRSFTFADDTKHPSDVKHHTLDPHTIYFDSCVMCNSMFVHWALDNIAPSNVHLKGHCNAEVLTCTHQCYYGPFKMWLNS